MKHVARVTAFALLLVAATRATSHAYELEQGINPAGIIRYPTALNQPTTHTLHGTIELTDIAEPELNLYNLRYGFQYGVFSLITDFNWRVEPVHEFDYAEVKAKLQVLALDEFRSYLALGLLGRAVEESDERVARIEDKTASLFAISTFELFPFRDWGGFLVNAYLDNRFFVLGLKLQLYQSIQLVAEAEKHHSVDIEDDTTLRAGVALEGLQNFYFQLIWTDEGEHLLAQVGTAF